MNRKTLAITTAFTVAALAAIGFWMRSSSPKNAALTAREHALEKLGEAIARLRPGCKVLVLSNPFTKESGLLDTKAQFERAGIRGLREGLGEKVPVTVVFPEIRPEYFTTPESVIIPPDSRTPLSFLIRPGAVEKLADAHPDCNVIVSLIGLPEGIDRGKLWRRDDPRSFALLLPDLRLLGPPEKAVEACQRGKLLAAVAEDATQPGTPLIITSNNIHQVIQRQPQALGY